MTDPDGPDPHEHTRHRAGSPFHVSGRRTNEILLWPIRRPPAVRSHATSTSLDIGVDEDANIAWAVEKRIDGIDAVDPDPPVVAAPTSPPDRRPSRHHETLGSTATSRTPKSPALGTLI
ncbi:MAG: hypothetical protein WKF76_10375 [Nocardioidaceae bacterium]